MRAGMIKHTFPHIKAGAATLALTLGVALPATFAAAPAPALAAAGDLDSAVTALRGIATMKADFTQTDRSGRSIGGELSLKRPGSIARPRT